MPVTCTGCGGELGPSGKFCPDCGAPRTPSCHVCGAEAAGGKFCAECGAPLTPTEARAPAAAPASPVARVSERRLTSVLFGDLVGFTPLSESRDPEEVRELLSRYFERARTIVGRYDGTVEKFIGDAVMAVWGVPMARENDAERAVRAGLELVSMVTDLGQEVGVPDLSLRVGITTGEVAVTVGATAEGMVAGDAVNTAARVQSAATPGEVWVDDATRSLAAAAIQFTDAGTHELKGKSAGIRLFSARTIVASVGGEQRADDLEPPFTGRERQLRLVKELLHETVEEGRPRLVLISGPAGIGKTRLAWEFEKYIDGLSETFAWHRGRCMSYGDSAAFWALSEVVRSRLSLLDGDPPAVVDARLAERMPQLFPDAEERAWVTPRLEPLLGRGERAGFAQDDLFAAWTRFLERAGTGSPVIIVLEDLHAADSGLLEFIERLLAGAAHPIHVLGLARPDLLERRPELLTNRRVSILHLEPLPSKAMTTLIEGLVGGLTDEMRASLVQRAEGIPLYAVETVRALIDRGTVAATDDGYVLARTDADLSEIGAPASLHALVASRLDALPADERRLVAQASVLGLSFSREALVALSGAEGELGEVIARLVRRDVLNVQADRFSASRGQLRFVQAVVRQVAYETLSRRDRRAAHLAAAAFLTQDPSADELSPVTARHLLDAVEASSEGDGDVQELTERAVELLLASAERALDLGAAGDALRHVRLALIHTQDPTRRVEVEEKLVRAALHAGDLDACLEHAEHVLAALDDRDPARSGAVAATAARALIETDRQREAIALLEPRLEALREDTGSSETTRAILAELASAYSYLGDHPAAARIAERHLDAAEQVGSPAAMAPALLSVAIEWALTGRLQSARSLLSAAVDFARRAGNPSLLVRSLLNEATQSTPIDLPTALASGAEAVRIGGRASASFRLFAEDNYSMTLYIAGEWAELRRMVAAARVDLVRERLPLPILPTLAAWLDEATGSCDTSLKLGQDHTEDSSLLPWWSQHPIIDARRRGDRDAMAAASAECMAALMEAGGLVDDFAILWPPAVLASIEAGQLDQAAQQIALVADAPRGAVPPLMRAQLLRLQGTLRLKRGESPEDLLRDAIDALGSFGAIPDAARTRQVLGTWLLQQEREIEAAEMLDAARATYEQLGANAWLTEVAEIGLALHEA